MNAQTYRQYLLFPCIIGLGILLSGGIFFPASAQEVNIGIGTTMVNSGKMVLVNNARIVNNGIIRNDSTGSISLSGNWINNGYYTGEAGSTVIFNGDSAQNLGGNTYTIFNNLLLNNKCGFGLSNNIEVNGTLAFQGGILTTGSNMLKIGAGGSITGADSTGYVNGKLAMSYAAPATKMFPIGKGGKYHPLTLQITTITGTSIIEAEQFETPLTGTMPSGVTLLTTGRSWTITQTGGVDLQYFLTIDPRGYSPTHSVLMLKKDAGTIAGFTTNSPYYTNTQAFTSFSEFGLGEGTGYDLTGSFRYPNKTHTALDSVWVVAKQNNIPTDSILTRISGSYTFSNKNNGTYTVSARTSKPWLGGNSTDALKVQRHFAGKEYLTEPIKLQAADVDNNGWINDIDALRIKRRFAELDNYFELGDWTYAKPTGGDTVIVDNSHVNQNFYGICVGDVTASNIPGAGGAGAGFLVLEQNGIIRADPGEVIEIPVKVSQEASIGAISLVTSPSNLMQVNEVNTPHGTVYFNDGENGLRMAWSENSPLSLSQDQTMLTLVVKVSEQFSKNDEIRLVLQQESEIANAEGDVFDTLILNAPTVMYKYPEGIEDNMPVVKLEIYPVPNRGEFTIEITSANQKKFSLLIYNPLGQVIHAENKQIVKGKSVKHVILKDMPGGIYTVVLKYDAGSETRKMVICH